ncbi:MAG: ACP S-malonyltransferase [Gammaproteobacteria bacterium]
MPFAIVFSGQGSQSVGMLTALADAHETVAHTFEEASDALGFDLARMMREGPAEALNQTENTQPALLAAGVAIWRLWEEKGGPRPAALAGHSLGEYTALAAAGVFGFGDALRLVHLRGRFMQQAVPAGSGAMAAIIGLDIEPLHEVCAAAGKLGVVAPANLNSPGQIVISGEQAAVEKAGALANEAGAKRVIPLAVSVPSHCALMQPAADLLAAEMAGLKLSAPSLPVINNADVAAPDEPAEIADALLRQLTHLVRWTEVVESLRDDYGADSLLEFGPGGVLVGLARRIDRGVKGFAVSDPASFDAALVAIQ